jgi:hypothetical protein
MAPPGKIAIQDDSAPKRAAVDRPQSQRFRRCLHCKDRASFVGVIPQGKTDLGTGSTEYYLSGWLAHAKGRIRARTYQGYRA